MLNRGEWTRRNGTSPVAKGLIWFTDGLQVNFRVDQKSKYLLWQPGGSESSTGCQNISTGSTVPKGVEWYLHPAFCGAVLGPWTCWGMRKRNHRQACKRPFCSEVWWTWAGFGYL